MEKTTLVIGASPNPSRFSYKAVSLLDKYNIPVFALGIRDGNINGIKIIKEADSIKNIHTVTLYVGKDRQQPYYDLILKLQPQRIIFNPGTENNELFEMAKQADIDPVEDCTLVMLNSGRF